MQNKPASSLANKPYLIFDGFCNLCVAAVRLLYVLDRHSLVRFVPYQTISDQVKFEYSLTTQDLQGQMHLVLADGRLLTGPQAISEVCTFLCPLGFLCRIFKSTNFQKLYKWLAGRRYQVFGCRQSCYLTRKV
jgi:predicted DCC family thiol-disulfide oxidoreductase YuxK